MSALANRDGRRNENDKSGYGAREMEYRDETVAPWYTAGSELESGEEEVVMTATGWAMSRRRRRRSCCTVLVFVLGLVPLRDT